MACACWGPPSGPKSRSCRCRGGEELAAAALLPAPAAAALRGQQASLRTVVPAALPRRVARAPPPSLPRPSPSPPCAASRAPQVGGIAELLAQRSAVDLKDKWRNLVRRIEGGAGQTHCCALQLHPCTLWMATCRLHAAAAPLCRASPRPASPGPLPRPLWQTRVAKLPRSVLKVRAHKSTSDIPLHMLLTGEGGEPVGCARAALLAWAALPPAWGALRRAALRACQRRCLPAHKPISN